MAEPASYTFDTKEVVTALLKQQGIHEGMWTLIVNFAIAVTNIGKEPNDAQLRPGVVTTIEGVGLTRAGDTLAGLTFDAAKLNPKMKKGASARES